MGASLRYADAGVDIDRANNLVEVIKTIAKDTHRPGVLGEIGGFGGLFSLSVGDMERPVLVSSTDGVGTKLKIAFMTGRHDTIGIDLVAMSVNDIVVQGAKPLFFLDYLSMGRLSTEVATDIIRGVGEGCRKAECALIGGETAEMPGLYADGEYDLAGFAVGVVDNDKIIDGSEIGVGHRLIGIASSGLHSNGYSLVRKICFEMLGLEPDTHVSELGCSLADELLTPTKIYVKTVQSLCRDLPVHGLVHVTGGGFTENITRVLPHACSARLYDGSWDVPPIFGFLQRSGDVAPQEMLRTFNLGIGMIVIVPREAESDVLLRLSGMDEPAFVIGEVVERETSAARIQWT